MVRSKLGPRRSLCACPRRGWDPGPRRVAPKASGETVRGVIVADRPLVDPRGGAFRRVMESAKLPGARVGDACRVVWCAGVTVRRGAARRPIWLSRRVARGGTRWASRRRGDVRSSRLLEGGRERSERDGVAADFPGEGRALGTLRRRADVDGFATTSPGEKPNAPRLLKRGVALLRLGVIDRGRGERVVLGLTRSERLLVVDGPMRRAERTLVAGLDLREKLLLDRLRAGARDGREVVGLVREETRAVLLGDFGRGRAEKRADLAELRGRLVAARAADRLWRLRGFGPAAASGSEPARAVAAASRTSGQKRGCRNIAHPLVLRSCTSHV
jgi:hypothetical protein